DARPLIDFLEQQETEQNDSLAARRGQRENEIRSRLLGLGWVEGDFDMREKDGAKRWKSLVCIAKPLTERNWGTVLSQLTPLLERSRELRLEAEAAQRRQQRFLKTSRWLTSALRESKPYARMLDCPPLGNGGIMAASDSLQVQELAGPSTDTPKASVTPAASALLDLLARCAQNSKRRNGVLKAPFPASSFVLDWGPFKQLLDTDASMEDFEFALAVMRPTLDQLLAEWRVKLEELLVGRLPCDNRLATEGSPVPVLDKETSTSSDLAPKLAIEVDSQPIGNLPVDTQRLLRADVVWSKPFADIPCFYTDDFQGIYGSTVDSMSFHTQASEIAKVLLATLGYPNATYIQVKAVGPAFTCGRCCARKGATWGDMLQHYLDEQKKWDAVQSYKSHNDGRLTYVFTHNTKTLQSDKPLVRMATDEEKQTPYPAERNND
ncbi:hypothetical protein FRC06_011785, partial [Ceratobasidium sp. 370]